ncbi:MAG TPA: hypothetical protein VND64_30440 [Pirellulales bacterium]|nr:hypothetical protein [Pirellulales bacterium]
MVKPLAKLLKRPTPERHWAQSPLATLFVIVVLGIAGGAAVLAQPPSASPEPVTYRVIFPRILVEASNLSMLNATSVQEELGLTDVQKERQSSIVRHHEERLRAARELAKREDIRAALIAAWDEMEASLSENLEPGQRNRLDQIQLQTQGPAAFGEDDLPRRLNMSDSQIKEVRAIANESLETMLKATLAPLPPDADRPSTLDSVRKLVKSDEFRSAKEIARRAVLESWAASTRRIEQSLTEAQRTDYRKLLGKPYDLEKLLSNVEESDDVALVASSLGLTGQRADPDFDVTVAEPAYSQTHPSVLFDEGHRNFHTAGGRYKVFADLITNDGYRVTSSREEFSDELLAEYDVLVIANATAEATTEAGVVKSAFTASECDTVEGWVKGGGSLLLITDHEPFGSASEELARRFGVDMSKKVTDDPDNSTKHGLLFSREKDLVADHPITKGRDESERINRVLTFTGQSLKGPPGSVAFLKFAETAIDVDEDNEVSAAGRAQGVAFAYGKGRVVVLGEAAQLSAQVYGLPPEPMGMNVPGCDNRQMALNIMHWLSGLME